MSIRCFTKDLLFICSWEKIYLEKTGKLSAAVKACKMLDITVDAMLDMFYYCYDEIDSYIPRQ